MIEDQRAFPFFWMGVVRYSGCTKDYSSVLEPPGGLVRELQMGGWLLLGLRANDAHLGGVWGWIRSGKEGNG